MFLLQFSEFGEEIFPHLPAVLEYPLLKDGFQGGQGRRAGQGIAAEGRSVAPRYEGRGDFVCCEERPDGKAVPQGLRQRDHVRHGLRLFAGEERPRPAYPRLDLVRNHEEPFLIANPPDPPEIPGIGNDDAALPLDRLDENAAGFLRHGRLQRRKVVVRHIPESLRKRCKADVKSFLRRRRHGRQRPAVEGVLHRDQFISASHVFRGVLPGEFDRRLVGLRPAVAEERLVERRILHEKARQKDLRRDVVEVRDVEEVFRLLFDCGDDPGVSVAEGADGDPPDQIEITAAFAVPDMNTQPPRQDDGKPFVGRHDIAIGQIDPFLCGHLFLTSTNLQTRL